jgi:GrpB-like predicted nucleotidyltransferase (UPF0157 family)
VQSPLDDPVEIVPHDPRWAERFAQERERLLAALGGLALAVEHVGSTAVPGLAAKPVLDILVASPFVPLPPQVVAALEALGYQERGDRARPPSSG